MSPSFEGKESLSINKADGFKIMSLNVFSLSGRLDQLNILMEEEKPHVIGINETKIDLDITDIQIEGYEVVRRDRNKWGGGVALYIHKSISANYPVRLNLMHYRLQSLSIQINPIQYGGGGHYGPPTVFS